MMKRPASTTSSTLALLLALTAAPALGKVSPAEGDDPVLWKPVPMALLRIDDAAPKSWQVYRAAKRKQLLLVQIGARFVMLDVEARRAYELAPRTLTRKESGALEWRDPGQPAAAQAAPAAAPHPPAASGAAASDSLPPRQLLASAEWSMRDVGPMQRIVLRLTDEGRWFNLQIPIQPDLRQFY